MSTQTGPVDCVQCQILRATDRDMQRVAAGGLRDVVEVDEFRQLWRDQAALGSHRSARQP